MTFNTWIRPLLDYYKYEAIIFTDYIRPNKHGTFSVRNAPEAQAGLGASARYLYKVRGPAGESCEALRGAGGERGGGVNCHAIFLNSGKVDEDVFPNSPQMQLLSPHLPL